MSGNGDLNQLRHSAAHILAQAVIELFPNTTLTIGPSTPTGFFYDFLPETNFKEEDIERIEERMRDIAKRDLAITHTQVPKDEARQLYKDNIFKLELIEGIPGDTVGIARQGDFFDLCKGGHVDSTGLVKHFKLTDISGAYWRANRDNQPLQRIRGTAFFSAKELRKYEQRIIDAQRYDHRKLGKQLDLFSFHEEGPGFPFFHAKGKKVLNIMTDFLRTKLDKANYQEVATPIMLSQTLWKQSGHYEHYKNNMYFCTIDNATYAIRPMNCPGSILLFKERPRSYKELPLRLAEFGLVHRYELSGVLHGLFRARSFTQDDGHIFCMPNQIEDEVLTTINMVYEVFGAFGFDDITVCLSTRPEKAMGSDELWEQATQSLHNALQKANIEYSVQDGEGAFYGPKIEFHIKDSMDRSWQCATIQLDFFQPERFELGYVASSGLKERPVMIHRAIYGSFERFFGMLLEHFKGRLPFWLAPIQVRLLPITDDQQPYALELEKALRDYGVRVECDTASDPLSGKIKSAQLTNVPWMIILGGKEMENKTVTIRYLDGKQNMGLSFEQLIEKIKENSVQ